MFKEKFIDGTTPAPAYLSRLSSMIDAACEAEDNIPDLDNGDFANPDWIEGESMSLPEV